MHWSLGRALFWTTIGLVAGSFVLALVGEEMSPTRERELILHWHEWIGLLSLFTLIATLIVQWFGKHARRLPLPHWLPWLRGTIEVMLYILLVLQPLSGWLLASHEGKLASFFGWTLPPLASPSGTLADYGYVYHGFGGALILLIAALSLRLNLTAFVFSLVRPVRRRGRAASEARRRASRNGT